MSKSLIEGGALSQEFNETDAAVKCNLISRKFYFSAALPASNRHLFRRGREKKGLETCGILPVYNSWWRTLTALLSALLNSARRYIGAYVHVHLGG